MRRRLVAMAAIGALAATPAAASEGGVQVSGVGEFVATYLDLDDGGKDVIQGGEASHYWTLGGGGALDVAWRSLNVQVDLLGEGTVGAGSADDTYERSYGGDLHVGWRNPERGSFGIFGSVGEVSIHDEGPNDSDTVVWGAGLEAQAFFGPFTLYSQAGLLDRESVANGGDVGALKNAGFGRAVGRYFFLDDLDFASELSYTKGKMDPDEDDVWILGWGAEFEYRLRGTPLAGFVGYTGARYEQDDDADVLYEHRVGFGLRVYLGQASLLSNDRRGASLDVIRYRQMNGQIAGALE